MKFFFPILLNQQKSGKNPKKFTRNLVPLAGLEPARSLLRGILSPLRLPIPPQRRILFKNSAPNGAEFWRRHPDLNRGIKVLQTLALPLGYSAALPCFVLALKKEKTAQILWSGKRDSNPRHSPWQGDALPLSYSRIHHPHCFIGGSYRVRTYDPLLVRQMLSQLS